MARELHHWKKQVIRRAQRADGNVLIVAPTGSGKTVIAAHLMRGSKRVLFVAHRRELIAQAEKRCVEWGVKGVGERVILQSKQSLERGRLPEAEVVIFDEAHHVPSDGWSRIHKYYRAAGAKIYGLTATPIRLDGKGLAPYFDTLIQAPPASELAALGHIVLPRVFVPKERIDLREVQVKDKDFDLRGLDRAARKVVGSAAKHWGERAEGRQTVVYAVSIAHAEELACEFRQAGAVSEVISGKLSVAAREAMLARFADGATQVLVNCEILTEGWDCPSAKCVVLARPTLSFGLLTQMIGRVTRPSGQAPVVLDLADNCRYFDRQGYAPTGDLFWTLDADVPKRSAEARLRRCPVCGELTLESCECTTVKAEKAGLEVVDAELEVWFPDRRYRNVGTIRKTPDGRYRIRVYTLEGSRVWLGPLPLGTSEEEARRIAYDYRGVSAYKIEREVGEDISSVFRSMYEGGKTSEEIARKTGFSSSYVLSKLKASGVKIRSRKKLAQEQLDDCVTRYIGGETAKAIGLSVGVCKKVILDEVRARGLEVRVGARSRENGASDSALLREGR